MKLPLTYSIQEIRDLVAQFNARRIPTKFFDERVGQSKPHLTEKRGEHGQGNYAAAKEKNDAD